MKRNVAVIFLLGGSAAMDKIRSLELVATHYVAMPFVPADLLLPVAALVDGRIAAVRILLPVRRGICDPAAQ